MQKAVSNASPVWWLIAALTASTSVVAISFWIYPRAAAIATLVSLAALLIEIRLVKKGFGPESMDHAFYHHRPSGS